MTSRPMRVFSILCKSLFTENNVIMSAGPPSKKWRQTNLFDILQTKKPPGSCQVLFLLNALLTATRKEEVAYVAYTRTTSYTLLAWVLTTERS
jgi:hypothetical protein